jgi:hypothetical protein
VLLDLWREAEQSHELGDRCTGYALPAGDGGLIANLTALQGLLPLYGFSQQFPNSGRLAFGNSWRKCPWNSVCLHLSRSLGFERNLKPHARSSSTGTLAEIKQTRTGYVSEGSGPLRKHASLLSLRDRIRANRCCSGPGKDHAYRVGLPDRPAVFVRDEALVELAGDLP